MLHTERQKEWTGIEGRKDDISWQSPWVMVPFVRVSCFLFRSVGSYHIYTHTFTSFLSLIDPGSISSYFTDTRDLFPTVAYTLFPAAATVCFLLDKWLRRPADRSNAGPSFSPNIKVPEHAEVHIRYSLNDPELPERLICL